MQKQTVINNGCPSPNRCDKCGRVFHSAIRERRTCFKCKGATAAELKTLLGFEGGHVVEVNGQRTKLVA